MSFRASYAGCPYEFIPAEHSFTGTYTHTLSYIAQLWGGGVRSRQHEYRLQVAPVCRPGYVLKCVLCGRCCFLMRTHNSEYVSWIHTLTHRNLCLQHGSTEIGCDVLKWNIVFYICSFAFDVLFCSSIVPLGPFANTLPKITLSHIPVWVSSMYNILCMSLSTYWHYEVQTLYKSICSWCRQRRQRKNPIVSGLVGCIVVLDIECKFFDFCFISIVLIWLICFTYTYTWESISSFKCNR